MIPPRPDARRSASLRSLAILVPLLIAVAAPPGSGAPSPVDGDPPPKLTLTEAVEAALATHPSLRAAQAREAAAREQLAAAEAERRPSAEVSGTAVHHREPLPVTPIHGFSPDRIPEFDDTLLQGGLQVRQVLWDGGARSARIEEGAARLGEATAGREAAGQQLVAATADRYLEILSLAAELQAHRQRLESLAAEERRVAMLLRAGRAAEVQLRRAEAERAAAEADRVAIASQLRTAEAELARWTGLPSETTTAAWLTPVVWAGGPLAGKRELLDRALETNPAVARAEQELAAARAALALADSGHRPRLRLQGDLQELGSAEWRFETEWSIAAQVAIRLYDGGRVKHRTGAAAAARDAVAEELLLVRLEIEGALDRALAASEEAAARVESLQRAEAAAEEVVRIERLRLENGVGTQNDFLDAEASLLGVRAGLARARHGASRARIEVERVAGGLGPSWLAANLGPPGSARPKEGT